MHWTPPKLCSSITRLRLKEQQESYLRKNSGVVTALCITNCIQHSDCGIISHRQPYFQKLLGLKIVTVEVPHPRAWQQLLLLKTTFSEEIPFQDQISDWIFSSFSLGCMQNIKVFQRSGKTKMNPKDMTKLQLNLSVFWKINYQV